MTGDRIEIERMTLRVLVGAYAAERIEPQDVYLDLSFPVDTIQAAQSDDLRDTIDYRALVEHLQEAVQSTKFVLLETLGEHITQLINTWHQVAWVKLRLYKPNFVPLADRAAVVIERSFCD